MCGENMTITEYIELGKLAVLLISSIAIPVILVIISNNNSKIREIENKLREDRIEIYNKVLEPFFLLYTTEAMIKSSKNKEIRTKTNIDLMTEKAISLEYQYYAFKLALIGSDEVVKAFNNLMQLAYTPSDQQKENHGFLLINKIAVLFLEIRKNVGNDRSKLHAFEMLEWKMTDIRKYKKNGKYPNL